MMPYAPCGRFGPWSIRYTTALQHPSAVLSPTHSRSSAPCHPSSSAVEVRLRSVEQTKQHIEGLRRAADQHARPPELGNLEITVTPVGPFDRRTVEAFAAAGVHR